MAIFRYSTLASAGLSQKELRYYGTLIHSAFFSVAAEIYINKTIDDGFMARHILSWPSPDFSSHKEFSERTAKISAAENQEFMQELESFWSELGRGRVTSDEISR